MRIIKAGVCKRKVRDSQYSFVEDTVHKTKIPWARCFDQSRLL